MTDILRPYRSASFSRKSRLLCATALVGALVPLASAQAQDYHRYTTNSTYDGEAVIPNNSIFFLQAATGITGTYVGNMSFGPGSALVFGSSGEGNEGIIIFAPDSITSRSGSQNAVGNAIINSGTVRFGNDVSRSYFSGSGTNFTINTGGVLDLSGADQHINWLRTFGAGAVINDVADSVATLTLTSGNVVGSLHDGAGVLRLRKTGGDTLRVGGQSTYSGGTEISYGIIEMSHANALGTGAIEFTSNGPSAASLAFRLTDESLPVANDMIISGTAGAMLNVETDRSATLSGTISGGRLIKYGAGTLTLTGQNTYTGGTDIQFGTLVLDSTGGQGAIADDTTLTVGSFGRLRLAQSEIIDRVVANGQTILDHGARLTVGLFGGDSEFRNEISGHGTLVKEGTGSLELIADSTFTGGTSINGGRVLAARDRAFGTGSVNFHRPPNGQNVLELSNGVTISNAINVASQLTLQNNGFSTLAGTINGNRGLEIIKIGQGTISLSGRSENVPQTVVREGALSFDGRYGGDAKAEFGGTITGSGTIDAHVVIADGGRLLGRYDQTLTMRSLTLSDASDIEILVDEPGDQAFFEVLGDLTLDGRLHLRDDGIGRMGEGVYRLFNYGGLLTDNGLDVASMPEGSEFDIDDVEIQTAIDKQVNVVVGGNEPGPGPDPRPNVQFWDGANTVADGAISGGNGTWRNDTTNWTRTNGDTNDSWGGRFAVFQGAAGTVTVDNGSGDISVTGMQFAADGYRVQGGAITLGGEETIIRVGDGSRAGADYTATIASQLRGDGALVKDDLGTLILTGQNSYRGDTIVRAGTLVGNTNSIKNNIASNGHVVFDQASNAVFDGQIAGRGTMAKQGAGELTLAGRSALDWSIESGGLISRTDLFGGNVAIEDGAFMRFAQNANGIYRGSISGSGALQVAVGSDNFLRLTEDSSAFAGQTSVTSGGLLVEGKLGGSLSMGTGTILGGNGTLGTTYIGSGATVSPENSIGTLTVNGNFTQAAGSTYLVEVNPEGRADLIDVSGEAILEGGTVRVQNLGGSYGNDVRYTILTAAGGIDGNYAGLDHAMPFLTLGLDYDDSNVYLDVSRNNIAFCDVATTRNQCAAAKSAERLGAGNKVYDAIAGLGSEGSAARAFDPLSGELHASAKTALLSDSRFIRDAATNRIRAAFGDATLAAPPVMAYGAVGTEFAPADTDAFALWTQAFGSWGHWDGDGNAARFSRDTGGLLMGGDAFLAD
jgi:autotransporter-associated beta strand protein